jgi:uncharacterized protein (TIGR00299 family) protein
MTYVLYFDAFNGVAGDMILGALLDLGLPIDYLRTELKKLRLEGYELSVSSIEREGLSGTNLQVRMVSEHDHSHSGHGRNFAKIENLIQSSTLNHWVKENSLAIFTRLAEAEAKVHGTDIQGVHFHEVGAVDAIVDIVGACIGFHYFEVSQFYTAPLNLGGGTITFSHGTWPVPAPATVELIKGFPSKLSGVEMELTTPTGAAIVTTLAEPVLDTPTLMLEKVGFGAGDRELPDIPNMLRLVLGKVIAEAQSGPEAVVQKEQILLLEASIDDMEAEMFGHFMELALQKDALDVFFTSIQMKKNRPGHLVSVLCRANDRDRMVDLIFRETTTLGLRIIPQERWVLDREFRQITTELGCVRIKIGRFRGEVVNIAPEYEDLRSIADQRGLPLKLVRKKVMDHLVELDL